jgi:predicted  nucleic acid-binding Zn-ribbon protein
MNMEYIDVLQKQKIEVLNHIHRLEDENDDIHFKIDTCVDTELKQQLESQVNTNEHYIEQLDDELMAIHFKIDELTEKIERGEMYA